MFENEFGFGDVPVSVYALEPFLNPVVVNRQDVGPAEADPKAGRVSYESALGKALIGHRVGDKVEIKTPSSAYSVRITAIE